MARAKAMLSVPDDADLPTAPCPFCNGAIPMPLSLWRGECPFCI